MTTNDDREDPPEWQSWQSAISTLTISGRRLLSNPYVRIILFLSAIFSIFTAGSIFSLGLVYVPIIDKSSLFGVLALYISIFSAILIIARYFIKYISVVLYQLGFYKPEEDDKFKKIRRFVLMLAIILLGVIFLAIPYYNNYTSVNNKILYIYNLFIITDDRRSIRSVILIIIIVFLTIPFFYSYEYINRKYFTVLKRQFQWRKMTFVFAQLGALIVIFLCGDIWINELRVREPTVRIQFANPSQEDIAATIVMPAIEGLLVFEQNDEHATYISWQVISRIQSAK